MKSRVVVITGALGGIGLASVEVFSKQGDTIIGIDIRDIDDPLVMQTKIGRAHV